MRAIGWIVTLLLVTAGCDRQASAKETYAVKSKAPAEVKVGDKGQVSLTIEPKPGNHVSDEAPMKISVKGKSVIVPKKVLSKDDATFDKDKGGVSFEVPFTAESAGKGSVDAVLNFYMCTEKLCERQRETVSVPVQIR